MSAEYERLAAALVDRYELIREIGRGGMATVYLARDVRHHRQVAIKVLHPELAAVLGAERFLAEIRTTANLQHPHILPLFDSGSADGQLFYVMPFVDGETLRTRLERETQLPIVDAVRIAGEVADALQCAHERNVIHRDIKPENILLQGGHALVADFGIALAVQQAGGQRMTQTGLSLGTPQYMSPEQAMGEKAVDARADIYALGAVTYEMLAGEPPFTGPTPQAIIAKVLTTTPVPITSARTTVPAHVEHAVMTALAKLPADRMATAAQFAHALSHADSASASHQSGAALQATTPRAPHGVSRHLRATPVIWGALAVISAIALYGWQRTSVHESLPLITVPIAPPSGVTHARGAAGMALSRDGTKLVLAALDSLKASHLFIRSLSDGRMTVLTPSFGASPALSPDGSMLAYNMNQTIQLISTTGGPVRTIFETRLLRGVTWMSDSTLVIASDFKLQLLQIRGGQTLAPVELLKSENAQLDYRAPEAVTSDLFLLTVNPQGPGAGELATFSVREKRLTMLGIRGLRPAYVASGIVTFMNEGALWGVPVDPATLKPHGRPIRIGQDMGQGGVISYAVSPNGVLVVNRALSDELNELMFVDRSGQSTLATNERRLYRWPRFSPDGRRVALGIRSPDNQRGADIWMLGADASLLRVSTDGLSTEPEWDPGGRNLIVSRRSLQGGLLHFERISADGGGAAEKIIERPNPMYESAITPDRRTIIWREDAPQTGRDILFAPVDSPTLVHPIRNTAGDERGIALSPDGKWLAYTSNETGQPEVYLCRIEPNGPRWKVSSRGGSEPRWARTGELFFRLGDSVFVSRVQLGVEPVPGTPAFLFSGAYLRAPYEPLWDVTADGKRFVMIRQPSAESAEILLMLNWVDAWRAGQKP